MKKDKHMAVQVSILFQPFRVFFCVLQFNRKAVRVSDLGRHSTLGIDLTMLQRFPPATENPQPRLLELLGSVLDIFSWKRTETNTSFQDGNLRDIKKS